MRQSIDVQVRQDGLLQVERSSGALFTVPFLAQVIAVYSDRMTCDLTTLDGQTLSNIPVITKGGLVDGKPYGEVDFPAVDDYVFVMHAGYSSSNMVVVGTFFPYLSDGYTADVVNSAGKTFTKKLFEPGTPLGYRRVFKSGVSVQIEEDGRLIVETPDGTHILFGGKDKILEILDSHGNTVLADSSGMVLKDKNGNDVSMVSGKVTINGNMEVDQ